MVIVNVAISSRLITSSAAGFGDSFPAVDSNSGVVGAFGCLARLPCFALWKDNK